MLIKVVQVPGVCDNVIQLQVVCWSPALILVLSLPVQTSTTNCFTALVGILLIVIKEIIRNVQIENIQNLKP